jgi:RND superfamily putative drug exporter
VAQRCAQRPGFTLGRGVVALGLLAVGAVGLTVTGFSTDNASPAGSGSAKGLALISTNFPPSVTGPTDYLLVFPASVWTSPHELESLTSAQQQLTSSSLVTGLSGPLDPFGIAVTPQELQALYGALGAPNSLPVTPAGALPSPISTADYAAYRTVAQFISPDGRTVQFTSSLRTGAPSAAASVAAVPRLRMLTASVSHGVGASDNGVYGLAPFSYDIQQVAGTDLLQVFPVVILLILLLLGLLLRSVIAPIFLLLTVGLSYVATLGLTNLIFVHIGGQSGINFVLPFLLFVFLVALGEDYNILVMSRIREETLQHGTEPAGRRRSVVLAVGATGGTVTSAGIILACTFAVVGFAGGNTQLEQMGTALALGVLLDTFIVRTLLVPSIVQLLGRWTWWPSRLAAPTAPAAPAAPAGPAAPAAPAVP